MPVFLCAKLIALDDDLNEYKTKNPAMNLQDFLYFV